MAGAGADVVERATALADHAGLGPVGVFVVLPLLGMMIDACSPTATQPTALTGLAVRTRQRYRVVEADQWPDGMDVTANDAAIAVTAPPGWVVARPLAADGELIRLVYEWGWRRRIMTVARRPDFATRIDAAAGGSTEVDEVTFADGSYGPHHGRLVGRRRRTDLPVVGRTLFVSHADATIAITCTAMGTDMASVEDDLADAESVAATIQLA